MIKFLIQLIGGIDNLMYALIMFIVMNCITAILVVIIDKKWLNGKLGLKIIFGKIGIIVPICIANIIDTMIVGNDFTIRTIVIYFYLSKEGFAILDNLEQIGVPFPPIIMKVIEQLNREESSDEKLTADVLQKAVRTKKNKSHELNRGKQTIKQLMRHNTGVANIEVTKDNIKVFESTLKKYGIDFAVKKDISVSPPRYLVFFKGRDADVLTAAFKEFSARNLAKEKKPSIWKLLKTMKEKAHQKTNRREKVKTRNAV